MAEENFNPSSPYWNKFGDESLFALYSPLFLSLAAGDLPANDFSRLISMYQRTLNDFEHGYVGICHASSDDDFEREAISHLKKSVKDERKTYELVIKTMLISPTKQKKIDGRENKYRAFLHDKSNTKLEEWERKLGERKVAPVYALAAIASSRRLYFNLCCRIQDIPEPNWVDHFSSQAYEVCRLYSPCCSILVAES
ncbi:hypothetical protein TIFTF001_038785 [Ficus carica]|uniref:Uncharacterized protein n=1 Tax=Ficus carica TaxID=3494 RepID=A0AA88JAA7_FICCA|nr:hypothetical protein TIFTF001_038785 [Ficus carica]